MSRPLPWPWTPLLVGVVAVLVAGTAGGLIAYDGWPPPSAAAGTTPPLERPPQAHGVVRPEDFGARGDGVTDDTVALQDALDSLRAGDTLQLGHERVYRHSDVLLMRRPGTRLVGPGALLAADEERSSLQLQAHGLRVEGVALEIAGTSRRWLALEQHRLVLGRHAGIVVADVRVTGSAGAGVFVDGAQHFLLQDLTVTGTRADGVHVTAGASEGVVRRPVVRGSGDDGVAVVSYQYDRAVTSDITIESPRVENTLGGRGVSVVGGRDIVYRDVDVDGTYGAGVYIATEGDPYFTRSTEHVQVIGARIVRANTSDRVDHGALLISAAADGKHVRDVRISDVTIRETRAGASRQVGVLSYEGEIDGVELTDVAVVGGGSAFQSTAPAASVRVQRLTVDGRAVPVGSA